MTTPDQRATQERLDAVDEIHAARDYHQMKDVLQYWGLFVPYSPQPMRADQGEIEHVEILFAIMRMFAVEWMTGHRLDEANQRIQDLLARIETLEEHTGLVDRS